MSTIRLTFLYPHLYKPRISRSPAAAYKQLRKSRNRTSRASFSTNHRRPQEETYAQRYGTAAEPQLPPPSQPTSFSGPGHDGSLAGAIETEVKIPPTKQEETKVDSAPSKKATKQEEESRKAEKNIEAPKLPIGEKAKKLDASESHPKESEGPPKETSDKPLETVLYRETSTQDELSEHKPPHLQAPPYVHHFDTFTLVRDLQKGGFTQDQSVTLMKAVRSLLSLNLDVARDGLISKSDVENETYLFRAACSELRTEILNARRSSHQRSSTQLSHLTHEIEIISQRLTQDTLALRDELRGMFNDRRMAVKMEQQAVEQSIQELNYKITVMLNSDMKSEVEGLRWVLTRRAAMAIATMAVLILGSLRYITYKIHVRDQERRLAAEKAQAASSPSPTSSSSSTSAGPGTFTVSSREMGTQTGTDTEAMLANVSEDGSPAYVSLG